VQLPGETGLVDAVEVPVVESTERWSDVTLTDGSVLRIKASVLGAVRVDGRYDQEGNPIYQVKVNQVMTVDAPQHLRKAATVSEKTH
jgi:hypothetical protein